MTLSPIQALTPGQQKPDASATATAEQRQVAQQFEAIFMRQLLGSMEKSGGLGGDTTGAGVYRSMMVGALADSAASGGGIGLAEIVLKAMVAAEPGGPKLPAVSPAAASSDSVSPAAVSPAALSPAALSHDATTDKAANPDAAPTVGAQTGITPSQ
jgi:flagellar protein FlgJ